MNENFTHHHYRKFSITVICIPKMAYEQHALQVSWSRDRGERMLTIFFRILQSNEERRKKRKGYTQQVIDLRLLLAGIAVLLVVSIPVLAASQASAQTTGWRNVMAKDNLNQSNGKKGVATFPKITLPQNLAKCRQARRM